MLIKRPGHMLPLPVILLLIPLLISAQQSGDSTQILADSKPVNKARLNGIIIGGSAAYAGSMTLLYQLWYKNYPQSSFHFINDNREWLQLDKCGHTTSTYYIGKVGYESLKWAGVDEKRSAIFGGSFGFVYLTVIEILDGFSAEWGASGGDLLANTLGSGAFISQQLIWKEQRISLKWSAHRTEFAEYRPDLLGRNLPERLIKDYNGQTYWISANIRSFLGRESWFPAWLNIAAGYGGDGMTGAEENPAEAEGTPLPYYERKRQFYIAPDIDLSRIKTGSPTLNLMLKYLSIFKFPLPALEFSPKGVKLHPVYF